MWLKVEWDRIGACIASARGPDAGNIAVGDPPKNFFYMNKKVFVLVMGSFLASCAGPTFSSSDADGIRSTMSQQEKAWNEGDIPGFMQAYDDSACFISLKERTCGKSVVTARYEKHYPDQATMGKLDFGELEILGAGADHAWCTGKWRLVRAQDTLSGGFSLFWVRTPAGWRVLRDHTY